MERRYGTRFEPVFAEIDRICEAAGERQVAVAIDGMCGSGKSTLGGILKERSDCNLFHMDDFFLRPFQRTRQRLLQPGGNVDYERFKEEILDRLSDREGLFYGIYDCRARRITRTAYAPCRRLNIIEGAYSGHPYFGDVYDLRIFCQVGKEEQLRRIGERNGAERLAQFQTVWIPMENQYFEACGIRERSALVIET